MPAHQIRVLALGGCGGMGQFAVRTALAMFAKGKIDRRGVFAPEGAIDPDAFFEELAPLCTPRKSGAAELVQIDVSNEGVDRVRKIRKP